MIRLTPRDRYLRRTYGVTEEWYEEILRNQNFSCAICLRNKRLFARRLAVDHNHRTGEVRGLLCPWCNRGLRYYRDDPEAMARGSVYLAKHTGFFAPKRKRKRKIRRKGRK